MTHFKTSLLREKFIIQDKAQIKKTSGITVMSNRMVITLFHKKTGQEVYVIRSQNMHTTVRLGAAIIQAFNMGEQLYERFHDQDWQRLWRSVFTTYEQSYNPDMWASIYYKGKPIFQYHDHHIFLDVIEKCNYDHDTAYEMAIPYAEDMIGNTGKPVHIDYDGNVALVVDYQDYKGRNGIILRTPERTATFSFAIDQNQERKQKKLDYAQSLSAAAAFLEGIQLAYYVGANERKLKTGEITRHSAEDIKGVASKDRLTRLSAEISNLENAYTVNYRPERPSFAKIIESMK